MSAVSSLGSPNGTALSEVSKLSQVLSGINTPQNPIVCLLKDPVCLLQDLVRNRMVDASGANSEALGGPRGSSRLQRGGSLQKLGAPRKARQSGQQAVLCTLLGACSQLIRWVAAGG